MKHPVLIQQLVHNEVHKSDLLYRKSYIKRVELARNVRGALKSVDAMYLN